METFPVIRITPGDPRYPARLAAIPGPPGILYARGNISLLDSFCIGVVGTRKASEYGNQACGDIAGDLATADITVVSGLAAGIDACAHRAALDAKGRTIAVFGTGIVDADIFPVDNLPLAHDILAKEGLLVSEYAPGTHGTKFTFPERNRIISGLSRGVVVVEADLKSGSLITAKCALEQGRDVFAVPGSIYWPRSAGTNWLIQQGARPIMNAADVLEHYRFAQDSLPEKALSTGDPAHEGILAILRENGPTHLDDLVRRSGHDASRVMASVSLLEIKGAVRQQGAGIYALPKK